MPLLRLALPLILALLTLALLPWLLGRLRLVWRLTWDRRVPFLLRLLAPLALIYALSPIDLVPDRWRFLGQADDLVLLLLASWLLVKLAPKPVVLEHLGGGPGGAGPLERPAGKVVEGQGRVVR